MTICAAHKQITLPATIQAMPSYRETMTTYICGQLLIATGKETTGRTLEFGLPPAIAGDLGCLPEHLHTHVLVMWVYYLHTDFYEAMWNWRKGVCTFARQVYSIARRGSGDKLSPLAKFAQHWLEYFGSGFNPQADYSADPKNSNHADLLNLLADITRWQLERNEWVAAWPALPSAEAERICEHIARLAARADEREETLHHYITAYTRTVMLRPATRDQMRRAFMEYMEAPALYRRGHVKWRVLDGLYRLEICEHLGAAADVE